MNRRTFLSTTACAAIASQLANAQSQPRRNILFIIADDQGLELGCYGNTTIKTPHLDNLAANGVRFTHGFAAVSSCSPSRSVMQTGLFNHTNGQYGLAHGLHNQSTLEWVESIPKLLKKSGYKTCIIGKKHVKPESVYPFDVSIEGTVIKGNRDVAAMAQKAGEFIRSVGDSPFYLTVGYSDPHRALKGFGNSSSYTGVEPVVYDPAKVRLPYFLPDYPEVRQDLADYQQSVSRLDAGIGLLMKELKDSGRDKDTLVIYVSDNGIPFPGAKTTLYDSGIRLPLIVNVPNLEKRGIVNDAMISWIDLMPTILEWANVKGSEKYQLPGRSFLSILNQEKSSGWDEVYASHTMHEVTNFYPMRAVRTRRFKYITNLEWQIPYPLAADITYSPTWKVIKEKNPDKIGEVSLKTYLNRPFEELYDLEKDPHELRNVAGDPAYAANLKELGEKLQAFRIKTKDPWAINEYEQLMKMQQQMQHQNH